MSLLLGLLSLGAPAPAAGCDTSCEPSRGHDLSDEDFAMWLASYARDAPEEPGLALETLLFYGEHAREQLDRLGYGPLDRAHRAVLERELARDTVVVEMRLIDDEGALRAQLPAVEIPLAEKQHLLLEETGTLGELIAGGRVKRVGLDHFWTRW